MSVASYSLAIRDAIKVLLNLDNVSCEVSFDGAPQPAAGELAVMVHPGNWSVEPGDYDLSENISVNVTVTKRMGFAPQDRWGIAIWTQVQEGLEPICRKIIAAIHQNQLVRLAANDYIVKSSVVYSDVFHEAIKFQGAGPPELKDYRWFTAEQPEDLAAGAALWRGQTPPSGAAQTLRFGGARRAQGVWNGIA
jgi:hypothetical protein